MTDRDIMQQALEALEYHVAQTRPIHLTSEVIHALRSRLAQPEQESFSPEAIRATQAAWKMGYDAAKAEQPEQEPVGEMRESAIIAGMVVPVVEVDLPSGAKLYTAPPQRKPLTEEQAFDLFGVCYNISAIRAVEAAHGIKGDT